MTGSVFCKILIIDCISSLNLQVTITLGVNSHFQTLKGYKVIIDVGMYFFNRSILRFKLDVVDDAITFLFPLIKCLGAVSKDD